MKEIALPSIPTLPTFTVPTSQPNYWNERFSYENLRIMDAMQVGGIEIRQRESSDFSSLEAQIDAIDLPTWIESVASAIAEGNPIPPAPSLPDFENFMSEELQALLIKILLKLILALIEHFLPSDKVGIAQILRKSFLSEDEESHPLVTTIQPGTLHLVVANNGDIQDIEFQ